MPGNANQAASLHSSPPKKWRFEDKRPVRCIAVASGKGGVGKTFITVNLAVALRSFNKRVLIVDADLGLANADIVLGVNPEYTLQDALFSGIDLNKVVTQTPSGVDLLAASSGTREMVSMGDARMTQFIDDLIRFASDYDVVLFDCASGINHAVTAFIAASPESIVICTGQPTSIMDVYALIKIIEQEQICDRPGLIINMVKSDAHGERVLETLNCVTRNYLSKTIHLLGIVPVTALAGRAVQVRRPLLEYRPEDPVSRRIRDIAKKIIQMPTTRSSIRNTPLNHLVDGIMAAQ